MTMPNLSASAKIKVKFFLSKISSLNQDKVITVSLALSFTLLLLTSLFSFILWQKLPPVLPFFYSLPWGDDQLANPQEILSLFGLSFIFLLLNSFLAAFLAEPLLKRLLVLSGLSLLILFLISFVKVLFLIL